MSLIKLALALPVRYIGRITFCSTKFFATTGILEYDMKSIFSSSVALVLFFTFGISVAYSQVTLLERGSTVLAFDFGDTEFYEEDTEDRRNFTGFGAFTETAAVFDSGGRISASQTSNVTSSFFEFEGDTNSGSVTSFGNFNLARNLFDVEFEVTSPTEFSLEGAFQGENTFMNGRNGNVVALSGPNTDISFELEPDDENVDFLTSGVLQPGLYDFSVLLSSDTTGFTRVLVNSEVRLQFGPEANAVPEPSSITFVLGLSLIALARRKRSATLACRHFSTKKLALLS